MTASTLPRVIRCPFCGRPVAGLLSGCERPVCRRIELDDDHRHTRAEDQ